MKKALFVLLFPFAMLLACGEDDNPANEDTLSDSPDQQNPLSFTAQSSGCGGFDNGSGGGDPPANYCDAEALYWTYDATAQTLELLNTRVMLNCCGEHSVELNQAGVLEIVELDVPPSDGRCRCTCGFDYRIDLANIPAGTLALELHRFVQEDEKRLLWSGALDLSLGNGVEIVDAQPAASCEVGP